MEESVMDRALIERIANEAGEQEPIFWGYDEQDAGQVNPAWLERFAALVAKECVSICYDHAFGKPGTFPDRIAGQAIGRVIEDIRERFGLSP
jgi:hypothetical protein